MKYCKEEVVFPLTAQMRQKIATFEFSLKENPCPSIHVDIVIDAYLYDVDTRRYADGRCARDKMK